MGRRAGRWGLRLSIANELRGKADTPSPAAIVLNNMEKQGQSMPSVLSWKSPGTPS